MNDEEIKGNLTVVVKKNLDVELATFPSLQPVKVEMSIEVIVSPVLALTQFPQSHMVLYSLGEA